MTGKEKSMTAYFEIRTSDGNQYVWPEPLGDKGEARLVIEKVGHSVECGLLFAYTDNYPYIDLEFNSGTVHYVINHRHSRLYWDGCVWARNSIEDVRYSLPDRVRLCVNGRYFQDVDYEEFARVVRNTKSGFGEPQYRCSVVITDPRVRFLALASLAYFDVNGGRAKCELYKRMNPTCQEALAALRRFGLDVGLGPNKADERTVYGHLEDFSAASMKETPAQILGRTIPLRVECEGLLEPGNLGSGTLTLSLSNEQTGVVLRGVEMVGGIRRNYAFRVPTEWARKSVVNIIEKISVSPTMPADREGCTSQNVLRIFKGDSAFSLSWGGVVGGTWHPLVRMARKLRLVYDMLKEDAAEGVEESDIRLIGEFKIAHAHVKDQNEAFAVFPAGKRVFLRCGEDGANVVFVQGSEDGDVLGEVPTVFGDVHSALLNGCHSVTARIESPCSHQGKPSACVVVVE